jgi:hypothetical protein
MTLELDEGDRQAVLLALARLAVERPGWDDMLNRIAMRIDNVNEGRAVLFDEFRALAIDERPTNAR